MKKYMLLILILLGTGADVDARQESSELRTSTFVRQHAEFDIFFGKVDKIRGQFVTNATVDVTEGKDVIAFWKVRAKCKEDVIVYYGTTNHDLCQKRFEDSNVIANVKDLVFVNNSGKNTNVSLQFKAFDRNRKWVGYEYLSIFIPTP